jgi:hypothetical protein
MKQFLFSRRRVFLGVAITALVAAPSQALASVDTSMCSSPVFSQPFSSIGDHNSYELVPGQMSGSFGGAGWTLSGGASVTTAELQDGSTTTVLDLPSGSKAVSPTICVSSAYPVARMRIRDVVGSEGVFFYVSYAGTNTATKPKNTGQVHGNGGAWSVSDPVNLQPFNTSGWQPMQITLVPGGKTSDFQIYDLYVDPHMMP